MSLERLSLFTDWTHLSAWEFRFGLRAGSFTREEREYRDDVYDAERDYRRDDDEDAYWDYRDDLRDAERDYDRDVNRAEQRYRERLAKAERDYRKDIDKAERKYVEDLRDLERRYDRRRRG